MVVAMVVPPLNSEGLEKTGHRCSLWRARVAERRPWVDAELLRVRIGEADVAQQPEMTERRQRAPLEQANRPWRAAHCS